VLSYFKHLLRYLRCFILSPQLAIEVTEQVSAPRVVAKN